MENCQNATFLVYYLVFGCGQVVVDKAQSRSLATAVLLQSCDYLNFYQESLSCKSGFNTIPDSFAVRVNPSVPNSVQSYKICLDIFQPDPGFQYSTLVSS